MECEIYRISHAAGSENYEIPIEKNLYGMIVDFKYNHRYLNIRCANQLQKKNVSSRHTKNV